MTGNVARAHALLRALARAGVRSIAACAGARNAPLLGVLYASEGFEVHDFFDERAAGFFALGRCKATGAPAAVITTSGTAAAELLPAVVEAHYSAQPLVVVTADRPERFRGSGAPQSILQVGLYGPYVERCLDLTESAPDPDLSAWSRQGPIHLNPCFDEPLVDDAIRGERFAPSPPAPGGDGPVEAAPRPEAIRALESFLEAAPAPLAVVGELPGPLRDAAAGFLARLGVPVYTEASSGLRGDPRVEPLRLRSGEPMVREACLQGGVSGVLRLGGVPTLRAWRDLDGALAHLPVLSLSHRPFSGLGRPEGAPRPLPLDGVLASLPAPRPRTAIADALLERDRTQAGRLAQLLAEHPRAEASLLRRLAERLVPGTLLYLGNSLPIREWDLVAPPAPAPVGVGVNRGANGIDGQLSTFFGMCRPAGHHVAVVGDLTALYDANAPWALRHLSPEAHCALVVVNNGGGRIFEPMFSHRRFQNPHGLCFSAWAAQWSLEYERWTAIPEAPRFTGRRVVELCPEASASRAFRAAYAALWERP